MQVASEVKGYKAFVSRFDATIREKQYLKYQNVLLLLTSGTIVLTIDEDYEVIDYFR
jgi:hypothetical protein